jgi:t-SNARE complex subunit (syntaxin)
LEESLEKDALINRINEKSNNLKNNSIDLKLKTRNKFRKQRRNRYLIIIGFIIIIIVLVYYFHHLYKTFDKKNNTKFLNNK